MLPERAFSPAELLAPRRERLSRLFDQMLDVIENAFQAREIFLVKGVVVDGGPDHYARLAGAGCAVASLRG